MEKLLLTGVEAAKILGVDSSLLKLMREQRGLPFVMHGASVRYPTEGIRDWVRKQTQVISPPVAELTPA